VVDNAPIDLKTLQNIYMMTRESMICFLDYSKIYCNAGSAGKHHQKKEWLSVSWGNLIQVLLNGLPFVVGGASIVFILLQYVLLGIFLMNLFVLIMIRLDRRKSEQLKSQQQLLKE